MFQKLLLSLLFTIVFQSAFAQFSLSDEQPPRHRLSTQLAYGNSTNIGINGMMLYGEYGYRFTKSLEASVKVGLFHTIQIKDEFGECCQSVAAVLPSLNLNYINRFEDKYYVRVSAGIAYQHAIEASGRDVSYRDPNGTIVTEQRYSFDQYNEIGYQATVDGGLSVSRTVDLGMALSGYGFTYFGEYISLGLTAGIRF